MKSELERHKRALLLLAKAFVELKGYQPFEVSQLAKEITVPEFLQQADREIIEVARMKENVWHYFYPDTKIIKEKDVIGFRIPPKPQIEEGNNEE